MFGEITLVEAINETETEECTIFAEVESITQNEFVAAGKKDIKPAHKYVIWSFEYNDQTEVRYNGKRFTVYRTFPRDDDKIELYVEERSGKR